MCWLASILGTDTICAIVSVIVTVDVMLPRSVLLSGIQVGYWLHADRVAGFPPKACGNDREAQSMTEGSICHAKANPTCLPLLPEDTWVVILAGHFLHLR